MLTNKAKCIYLALVMLTQLSVGEKDIYKSEMAKVITKYQAARRLKMTISTVSYLDDGRNTEQKQAVNVYADNDKYRYEAKNLTFVMNKKIYLYVDDRSKMIFYKLLDKPVSMGDYAKLQGKYDWLGVIDSTLKYCNNVTISKDGLNQTFAGHIAKGPYTSFSVTIAPDSTVKSMSYEYSKESKSAYKKVTADYTSVAFNPVFEKNFFSESPFVKIDSKVVKGINKYATYVMVQL